MRTYVCVDLFMSVLKIICKSINLATVDGKQQLLNKITTSTSFVFLCFDIAVKSKTNISASSVLLTVSKPKKTAFDEMEIKWRPENMSAYLISQNCFGYI